MLKNIKLQNLENNKDIWKVYKKEAPKINEINWYDLPNTLCVEVIDLKLKRKNIIIKTLKKLFKNDKTINSKIKSIFNWRYNYRYNFQIKLPFNLNNIDYVKLYSLMISEGSYNTEFKLHVPEDHLHKIFTDTLNNIFERPIHKKIRTFISKGVKCSYSPQFIRYFIPIPEHIPKLILDNKEFAREYLKVAFESEGYPYINKNKHKRYIKLTRNISVDDLINIKLKYKSGKRVFLGKLKKDYPKIYSKIINKLPILLLGESLLLSHHFNIENKIQPEALLINKTPYRRGFYSVRWNLFIYAKPIDLFIEKINFISNEKREKCKEMLNFRSNNPSFFALKIMKKTSKNNIFRAKNFNKEMIKLGYTTPQKYTWFYCKKGLIKRIRRGYYRLNE